MAKKDQSLANPFPGLRPFEAHENHLFFGRDGQSDELLKRLRRTHFVTVVGTSGSGKSSLVRAGLLPSLYGGFMAVAGSSWRVAVFRPGKDPIGNMARALVAPTVLGKDDHDVAIRTAILTATLQRSNLGLVEAVKQAGMPAHENLLLVVDQFEELFRFKQSLEIMDRAEAAVAFVQLLLEATSQKEARIYVVLTMRSDYLGDCAQFRDLPEAINDGQYLIPRMTREQRRLAIAGPIAVGGAEITSRLTQRLLNDVGDNPDQLPILQHALMRTWQYWAHHRQNSDPIDLRHYETIGGMDEALSRHADDAYHELSDGRSKKLAEKLFKCLTEKGPDNREIRRPTKLQEICAAADANEKEIIAVVERFRQPERSFLMPPVSEALNKDSLIDISHESLIRNWQRLKQWVDEEAQSARMYRRLAESAVLHQEGKAALWRDPDLQLALEWSEQNQPNQAWAQRYHPQFEMATAFLKRSEGARNAEAEREETARRRELQQAQALAEEQRKAAQRLRLVLALLTVFLVAAIFAVFAFTQRQMAMQDATIAESERAKSDSLAKAFAALYGEADSLQQIAMASADSAQIARLEAEKQRYRAVLALDAVQIERKRAETQASLADIRKNEALAARDSAQQSQKQVMAVALTIKSQRLRQLGKDTLSALLAYESNRLDESVGGHFRHEVYEALRTSLNALDARGGPTILHGHTGSITALAVSPTDERFASCSADSTIRLWDMRQGTESKIVGKFNTGATAIAFGFNGRTLASGHADGSIALWSLKNPNSEPTLLRGHSGRIWSLAFSPKDGMLVSASADGAVLLWDLQQNNHLSKVLSKYDGSVRAVAFSPDGKLLATGGADKKVLLWNLNDRNNISAPKTLDFQSLVRSIAFSPDGEMMAVGCEDMTVRLLWLQQDRTRVLRGHQKRVNAVAFSPTGHLLASGSSDKTVRLWDLQRLEVGPIVLSEHEASVWSVAFTAQGDTLITGTSGKNIRFWLTNAANLAAKIRGRVPRHLTLEEWQEFVGAEMEYPYTNLKQGRR